MTVNDVDSIAYNARFVKRLAIALWLFLNWSQFEIYLELLPFGEAISPWGFLKHTYVELLIGTFLSTCVFLLAQSTIKLADYLRFLYEKQDLNSNHATTDESNKAL